MSKWVRAWCISKDEVALCKDANRVLKRTDLSIILEPKIFQINQKFCNVSLNAFGRIVR